MNNTSQPTNHLLTLGEKNKCLKAPTSKCNNSVNTCKYRIPIHTIYAHVQCQIHMNTPHSNVNFSSIICCSQVVVVVVAVAAVKHRTAVKHQIRGSREENLHTAAATAPGSWSSTLHCHSATWGARRPRSTADSLTQRFIAVVEPWLMVSWMIGWWHLRLHLMLINVGYLKTAHIWDKYG